MQKIEFDIDIVGIRQTTDGRPICAEMGCSFRAVVCRVHEIKSLSCRLQISPHMRFVNCSILLEITSEHNAIRSHYGKSRGNDTRPPIPRTLNSDVMVAVKSGTTRHCTAWKRSSEMTDRVSSFRGQWTVALACSNWSLPMANSGRCLTCTMPASPHGIHSTVRWLL